MKQEKHDIENKEGVYLSARLELPVGKEPHNYVIFAHCFTCNKDLLPVKNISRSLIEKGFGILRFDFTGLGESQGEFAETNFSSNVSDLLDAAKY
ncbi:MAG: alpha/beta hydrolase family protein, partial [Flavobacteriales bacterium]